MKKIILFGTKPWVYLTTIPFLILLAITIDMHSLADGLFKFYPLEIALIGAVIVIFLFFYRTVSISFEELSKFAVFHENERDRVKLNVGNEIILTLRPHGYLGIEAYGYDGELPGLEWLQDTDPLPRYFFRAKALGGKKTAMRILRYFGAEESACKLALTRETYAADFEYISLSTFFENDMKKIRIKLIKEMEIDE